MTLASRLLLLITFTLGAQAPLSAGQHGAGGLVLVAGATGRTGQHVVEQLLEQGHSVRVLARNEAGARELFGDGVEVAIGDLREPGSLPAAMAGVRYIISTVGSGGRGDPANNPETVDYRGTKSLVEAAVATGSVDHFVLLTSMGVTDIIHPLNRAANNVLLWKALGENALRFSGIPYTIVRPGGLSDAPGGQAGIRAGQGDSMVQGFIPRADVAAVCVKALGNPDAIKKTLEVVADPASTGVNWEAFFAPLAEDEIVQIRF